MLLLRLNQIRKRYVQLKAFPATVSGDGLYNSRARIMYQVLDIMWDGNAECVIFIFYCR